jgi:putative salt-induced outer membrane protein YdiY
VRLPSMNLKVIGLSLGVSALSFVAAAAASGQGDGTTPQLSAQPAAPAAPKPAPPPWLDFHADLGVVSTSGNTDVSTLNASDALTLWTAHSNKVSEIVNVTYGTVNNKVQTSLWTAGVRDEYTVSHVVGFYALFDFDRNTFAGIEQRFEQGVGFAITPVTTGPHHLELDLGGSYLEQRSTAAVEDNYAAARGAVIYRYTFAKNTYIQESLEDISDLKTTSDYRINSQTDLVAPLSRHIAIKIGYGIRYANLPPPGFKTTDRLFTADLQFNL